MFSKFNLHLLLIFFLGLFFAFQSISWVKQSPPRGDEYHYLITAQSLSQDRDLWLENNYPSDVDPHWVTGRDGHMYLYHGLGLFPILITPAFVIAGRAGVAVFLAILYIALLISMYSLFCRLTKDKTASLLAAVVVGASIPLASFSTLVFPEVAAAFLITFSILMLVSKKPFWTFIALSLLVWIHLRFLPLSLLMSFAFFLKTKSKYFLFVLLSMAAYFLFHYFVYGSFSPSKPYTDLGIQTGNGNILQNIVLVLTDKQYGLLVHAPIFLLSLPGILILKKRYILFISVALATYALSVFTYYDWHGGYAPPARYLAAIVPFLALGLASFWSKARLLGKALFVVLSSYSIWMYNALVTNTDVYGFLYRDGYQPVFKKISESFTLGFYEAMPSFYPIAKISPGHYILFAIFLAFSLGSLLLVKKKQLDRKR